jgi:hypothetical protein
MDERQYQAQKRATDRASRDRAAAATQSPMQSSGGGGWEGAPPSRLRTAEPAPEPLAPSGPLQGVTPGDPSYRIEVGPDMQPRRVPVEPQADAGSFGGIMANPDAAQLVSMVREGRAARHLATQNVPSSTAPTVADAREAAQAQAAAQQADPSQIAKSMQFRVNTKTGHFAPVLPGQDAGEPGPHDIIVMMDNDPSTPNILAQGKRVTSMDLARLSDPKRGIQPQLDPNFQVPEEYAGIAEALGLKVDV